MLLRTARREGNRISFLWRDILWVPPWSILTLGVNEKTGLNTAIPPIPSHHSNSKDALAGKVSACWRHGHIQPESPSAKRCDSPLDETSSPKKGRSRPSPARFPPFDRNDLNLLVDKCYCSELAFFGQQCNRLLGLLQKTVTEPLFKKITQSSQRPTAPMTVVSKTWRFFGWAMIAISHAGLNSLAA